MFAATLSDVSNTLKQQLETRNYLDVGKGAEKILGVSQTKFNTAIAILIAEGYEVHRVRVALLGTPQYTICKVLTKPGTDFQTTRTALLAGRLSTINGDPQ